MTLFLYNICFFFFALFYLPVFFAKRKHKDGFLTKFGHVPDEIRRDLSGRYVLWIHAVSVGEAVLAARLASLIRPRIQGVRFVLTATTPAGKQMLEKLKDSEDRVLYFPVDFPFSVRRFVSSIMPRAVIVLETEIWPNLVAELSSRKIPIFIMNGRISDQAMKRYAHIKKFLKETLSRFSGIWVQDERMASRFLELGAAKPLVRVTGNLKYDGVPPERSGARAVSSVRLWVAGSTHAGEEEILFDAYRALKGSNPDWRLVIAPRHLERLPAIEKKAVSRGLVPKRVSEATARFEGPSDEVYLLDRMGVLAALYAYADIVFIGGSLVDVGGHNLVEPAYYGKPILFGPHMKNFKEMAAEFIEASAALPVSDASDLEKKTLDLMRDGAKRASLGAAARALLERHRGAAERNIDLFMASSC